MRGWVAVALAGLGTVGCAQVVRPNGETRIDPAPEVTYENEPRCVELVERFEQDRALRAAEPPSPSSFFLPPDPRTRRAGPASATIHLIVDETGRYSEASARIVSETITGADADRLLKMLPTWRFRPARHFGCWVPAPYVYEIRFG